MCSMPEKIMPDGEECGSHNHHFLGDVNRWFTCCLAGLNVEDSTHVRIAPNFIDALDFAEAYYELPVGRAEVKWERKQDEILMTVKIPEGVECSVELPKNAPTVRVIEERKSK